VELVAGGIRNEQSSRVGRGINEAVTNYQTPADYARTLTTAIARPATRDESSACRAIAQPAPIGVNINRAQVTAG